MSTVISSTDILCTIIIPKGILSTAIVYTLNFSPEILPTVILIKYKISTVILANLVYSHFM